MTLSASTGGSFDLYVTVPTTGYVGQTLVIKCWVKLGTATNWNLSINNSQTWNTAGGKTFTSADGLKISAFTQISLTFACPSLANFNVHVGSHANTIYGQATQIAGTCFVYGWQIFVKGQKSILESNLTVNGTVTANDGFQTSGNLTLSNSFAGQAYFGQYVSSSSYRTFTRDLSGGFEGFYTGALGTTFVGGITTNGSSTSYNTTSDYRLKDNVQSMTEAISRLQQVRVCRFNFLSTPDKIVDGFIAHEVQAVVPEAVHGEKDAVDEDGNPVYQGIDQGKMVPLLWGALQEAILRIEALESRRREDT